MNREGAEGADFLWEEGFEGDSGAWGCGWVLARGSGQNGRATGVG
jgi:hypothetical protein